jgi:capsular exopolysaccharide synthesis family protein
MMDAAKAQGSVKIDEFLKSQIRTQELTLATESGKYDEGHPRIKALKGPLEEMRKRAREQETEALEAYLSGLQQENNLQAKLAQSKVDKLQRDYDEQFELAIKTMAKASQFPFLKEGLDRSEKRSDLVTDRIMELSVSEDVGALNITVVEPAEAGEMPTSPKRSRTLGTGMMLGLMLGLGLAWLRDFLDHRLRSADEITALLELPLLGVLPHVSGKHDRAFAGQMVATRPRSEIAESFRTLRTAIYFGLPEGQAKTILVTSPSPADGKSTVASNLAIAMAQTDQSVLLIEADFRKPTQKTIFKLEVKTGFSKVFTDQAPLDEAIMATEIKGLSVLLCGPIPPNPVEILNSAAFRQALEELSQRFDKIIIDAPPVVPVADARVLGALCDITLLVLRAEKSTRRHALGARDELVSLGARILGVVVNSAPQGKGAYGYGRYGYGRYGYGGRYGGYGDGAADSHYKYDDTPSEKA